MVKRNVMITLGLAAALALPVAPALAAGQGQAHGHTKVVRHSTHAKSLRQVEGTVVSLASDGSSFVLRPMASKAVTVTVAIASSTVVTAAVGVTPTLAAGEQVHVAGKESNGTYWAVRVLIEKSAAASRGLGANKPRH